MFHSRIVVFQEKKVDNQIMFQWFREGQDNEDWLVEDLLLTPEEHWELLGED